MSEDKPVVSRWRRVGLHLLTVLLVLSVVVAVNVWRTRDAPAGVAPPIVGVLASGQQITLDEFRAQHAGRPVALYFWAEWCPVCRAEAHVVTRVMKDYPVLTIAMQSGSVAEVAQVLQKRELDWPTLVDADGAITRQYGLPGVPGLVLLDTQGMIRFVEVGYTTEIGLRLRLWWAGRF
ncbi:MAG: protein disulfide oxidoreductase [Moraxellaceae bacterium]|nr:protein disulfide oxidoreductase [Moraxellaceae bacterium]MBP9730919.1 protein disulfide oxidoreductase [Moraxellaceae bacterium]HQV40473.1 protein disulfide oxidoreductase [Moraxellaceae bacterium]HQX88887.1 protein disulfide oxidoreductase [Moraxellaceae bacterium]